MDFSYVPDKMFLAKDMRPMAICEAVQPLYIDEFEHVADWTMDVMMMQENKAYQPSRSFQKLLYVIQLIIFDERAFRKIDMYNELEKPEQRSLLDQVMIPILKSEQQQLVEKQSEDVIERVQAEIVKEEPKPKRSRTKQAIEPKIIEQEEDDDELEMVVIDIEHQDVVTNLTNSTEHVISEIIEQEHLITNASHSYQALRDLVTKKDFSETEDGELQKEILVDGKKQGVAEIRTDEEIQRLPADTVEKQRVWFSLLESTTSALDELSADLFDLIAFSWMKQPKNEYGYIHFDSEQALRLKFEDPYAKTFRVREKERFDIMQRVATLTSIWIAMDNDDFIVIDLKEKDIDRENYEFADFHPLFQIGSIEMAYDKKTKEAKGIYSVTIKPSPLIDRLLTHNEQAFAYLDYKVFQYNYYKHRQHKRVVRFLNAEWKNRQTSEASIFTVKKLLEIMDFGKKSVHGSRLRERFEKVLDDLLRDQVIKHWAYVEKIDEADTVKRKWYVNVWENLQILITPPEQLVNENKRLETAKMLDASTMVQQSLVLDEQEPVIEYTLLQKVNMIIEHRNITIKDAAAEAGVSYSTLHRYLNKPPKKISKKNEAPLEVFVKQWFSYVKMTQNNPSNESI